MIHKIRIDLLRVTIWVTFVDEFETVREKVENWLNCQIGDSENGHGIDRVGGFSVAKARRCVLWIGPQCKRPQVFHECYHATQQILHEIGCNGKDEEINAHLNEFINEHVLTLWEKHIKSRAEKKEGPKL
jgi:hypothetical protein